MSWNTSRQPIGAGSQYDGTAAKGRLSVPGDKSGVTVKTVSLNMGAEVAKTWSVAVVNDTAATERVLYESGSGGTRDVVIDEEIPIPMGWHLEVVTTLATSAMKLTIIWKDELP